MTNGTLLNKKFARSLKHIPLKFLQLSLDGMRETHDRLRGNGNYDRVIAAADLLHKFNIPCRISFTANQDNYLEFSGDYTESDSCCFLKEVIKNVMPSKTAALCAAVLF